MKIVYVHHGQRKIGNPPSQDDDLTAFGYDDCHLTARLFDDKSFKKNLKAIYCAPNFRCQKTAEIINSNLKVPIIFDERLNESGTEPNSSWIVLQKNVQDLLDEIVAKYNDEDNIICVTSGVNIVGFNNKAYGLEPSENAPFLGISSCSPIIYKFKKG